MFRLGVQKWPWFIGVLICCVAPMVVTAQDLPLEAWSDWLAQPTEDGIEPFGAEDRAAEGITPRIPEPMIFDLVRPLGERKGAQEVNVLALFPVGPRSTRVLEYVDPLGIAHYSRDRHQIEWAPEYEVAVADGFAIEFELPFEGDTLEAYKFAAQWTIGTALDDHFIHGIQGIVEPTTDLENWNLALLYLAGYRIDERWSMLGMIGGRTVTGANVPVDRTEFLLNFNLFADLTHYVTTGFETNFSASVDGNCAVLLTPQIHVELTDHIMVQTGVGAGWAGRHYNTIAALRAIYSF